MLRAPTEDAPRPAGGLTVLALGLLVSAGAVVHSASQKPPAPVTPSTEQTILVKTRILRGNVELAHERTTSSCTIRRTLDLHAERAAQEAERAYERVSGDLRHNLAFRVPIFLFRTTTEFDDSVRVGASPGAAGEPSGDRILLAIDQPADRWPGLITHEVAHIFAFDILPGRVDGDVGHGRSGRVRARRLGSQRSVGAAKRGARQCRPGDEPAAG